MSGRPITEPEQDDGSHRMKIAERYKWNAKLRKLIKMLSICQIAYIVLRTIWQLIPVALGCTCKRLSELPRFRIHVTDA